jgi:hypothetical protein
MSLSIAEPCFYDWGGNVGLSDLAFAMEIEEVSGDEGSCGSHEDAVWQLALPYECSGGMAQALAAEATVREKGERNFSSQGSSSGSSSRKEDSQRLHQQQEAQRAFDELGYDASRKQTHNVTPTEDIFCDESERWWDCEKEKTNKAIVGLELEQRRSIRNGSSQTGRNGSVLSSKHGHKHKFSQRAGSPSSLAITAGLATGARADIMA